MAVVAVVGSGNIVKEEVDERLGPVEVNRLDRVVDVVGMIDQVDQVVEDRRLRDLRGIEIVDRVVDHHAEVVVSRSLVLLLRRMDYVVKVIAHQ